MRQLELFDVCGINDTQPSECEKTRIQRTKTNVVRPHQQFTPSMHTWNVNVLHTHAYTQNVKSNFQHPARVSGYVSGYANECWFDICIHLTFNKQPSERTTEQMSTFYKAVQYKCSSSSYYFTWLNWAHHPSSLNAHCWVRAGKKNEMDFNLMNFSNLLCISSSTATVA